MAQFPVAIVGGHDGASAQPPLELLLRTAENIMRGLGHGKLHFCNGGHGDFRGHPFVTHSVISHIAVGKYIIAYSLARPSAAASHDHHPRFRLDPLHLSYSSFRIVLISLLLVHIVSL